MKLGRNNPCSCGSGKKFKNCCQGKAVLTPTRPAAPAETELAQLGALFNAGRLAEVENQARLLAERYTNCAAVWKLLGASRHFQGKDGIPALRKVVELQPADALAHSNLGNALKDIGQLEEAVASYRRALKLKPDLAGIHYNLGLTLTDLGQIDNALASYRHALALKPDFAEVHSDLGNALSKLGKLDMALASYRRALVLKPDYAQAHYNLGLALQGIGQLENALSSYRRALEIKPDFVDAHNNMLFVLNYTTHYTPAYCQEKARQFGQMITGKVSRRFTDWQCSSQPERLRVGVVSGDLRNHPVGYFLESLVTQLDATRIELVAYPTHVKEDALTARIKPHFAAWKSLASLGDEAAARLIHADGVHILLDLSGHSRHNRLPVFAWKPAPLQASWLGYFATTGVVEMDYLLADQMGVPETAREQFTEAIYYLPDTRLCFTPPQSDLPVAPLPALTNGNITVGCFQDLSKVGNNVLAVWGRIFAALPDAKLRMQCAQLSEPAQVAQMTERLRCHGIDPRRVTLYGLMPREAYLAAHAEVDLILDTYPYPGGTTTCEALWMGVPTLTLAGESLLARQGASLLTAAGLDEWVVTSEEEYLAKAIALAGDLSGLANMRATLRAKVSGSPLFDARRFARNFEVALWNIWKIHTPQQVS